MAVDEETVTYAKSQPDAAWRRWLSWPRELPLTERNLLFCFPYAGGGSWIFSRWPRALDPLAVVLPVVLPGREHRSRETPGESIPELAAQLSRDMVQLLGSGRYMLFGHSFGGFLVFELADQILKNQLPPPALVVISGCRAPNLARTWEPIHHLSDDQFEKAVESRFGPIPVPLRRDHQTLQIYLKLLRADLKAVETYQPPAEKTIPYDLLVCGGRADPFVPVGDLLAWRSTARGRFTAELFPGGHFFFRERSELFLGVLKHHLKHHLRRASAQ